MDRVDEPVDRPLGQLGLDEAGEGRRLAEAAGLGREFGYRRLDDLADRPIH